MQNLLQSSLRIKLSILVLLFSVTTISLSGQNCVEECECEGGLTEMTLYYFGDVNADVRVYGDLQQTQLIDQFAVTSGDDFTVSAAGLAGGYFPYYLYFEVDDGMGNECTAKIFAYCPSLIWPLSEEDLEIRGKRYGDLGVYSYRSQAGNVCDLDDASIDQDWAVGGNLVGPNNNTIGTLNQEDIAFITGSTEQAVLTTTGRLGLGTSSPEELLDVNGKALIRNDGAAATLIGGDHVFLEFSPDGNTTFGRLGYLSSGTNSIGIDNSAPGGDITLDTDDDILLESESVGIGVISPAAKLHVAGDRIRLSADGQLNRYLEFNTDTAENEINSANEDLAVNALSGNSLLLNGNNIFLNGSDNRQVAINTLNTPGNHSLYVGGSIIAEEVVVRLEMNWPDYVFTPDYSLPTLPAVNTFIQENGHLPNTPDAATIAANGLELGDMVYNQQEKIEMLFLYVIQLDEELKKVQQENENLRAQVLELGATERQ